MVGRYSCRKRGGGRAKGERERLVDRMQGTEGKAGDQREWSSKGMKEWRTRERE